MSPDLITYLPLARPIDEAQVTLKIRRNFQLKAPGTFS